MARRTRATVPVTGVLQQGRRCPRSPSVPSAPAPCLPVNRGPAWHALLTTPCPLPADNAETAAATMPDSPADVKTQARSTPPSMPPPPPAVTQGATRHPSFTPSTSEYSLGLPAPLTPHTAPGASSVLRAQHGAGWDTG